MYIMMFCTLNAVIIQSTLNSVQQAMLMSIVSLEGGRKGVFWPVLMGSSYESRTEQLEL